MELNMVLKLEFLEFFDLSLDDEVIWVEEFLLDDIEDDMWFLVMFVMLIKLEMDKKEEDILFKYYKWKCYKKKLKGYIKLFY